MSKLGHMNSKRDRRRMQKHARLAAKKRRELVSPIAKEGYGKIYATPVYDYVTLGILAVALVALAVGVAWLL